jgi:histidinol-phosphate aminotransferase
MITELLKKVKMPYNVNVLTQRKALEVLSNQEKIKSQVEKIVSNRILLTEILEKIDLVEKIYPSESNFLLIKVRQADRVYNQLIAKNLVIRNRSKEPLCEDCLRITVGTDQENNLLVQALLHLNENME